MSKVLLANREGQFSKTAVLLIVFCIGETFMLLCDSFDEVI